MSIEYTCDLCKDNKTTKLTEYTTFNLQIRASNWVDAQYYICPECLKQLNLSAYISTLESVGDKLLNILKDIVVDEIQDAIKKSIGE